MLLSPDSIGEFFCYAHAREDVGWVHEFLCSLQNPLGRIR